MKPPIFIDDNGDLNVFSAVESAEIYLEPEDLDAPGTRIYDSEGRLLSAMLRPPTSWLSNQLGLPGRRIHFAEVDQEPKDADGLRDALLRFLKYVKYTDEQLQNEPLSGLVELSLPYAHKS